MIGLMEATLARLFARPLRAVSPPPQLPRISRGKVTRAAVRLEPSVDSCALRFAPACLSRRVRRLPRPAKVGLEGGSLAKLPCGNWLVAAFAWNGGYSTACAFY